MRDQPGHADRGARPCRFQRGSLDYTLLGQRLPDVRDRVRTVGSGGPQVGEGLLGRRHGRQRRRGQPGGGAGQLAGPDGGGCPGRPQRRAPAHSETAERTRRGQRLDRPGRQPGAPGEVGQVRVRLTGHDGFGGLGTQVPDAGQVQPDRRLARHRRAPGGGQGHPAAGQPRGRGVAGLSSG